jgi:NAD(P)-dependent dehydrogenase (short-subunit alcohol dehydrogenase family)
VTLALVTGASRGIGYATSLALAARGVDVVLVARTAAPLAAATAAVAARGVRAQAFPCDLSQPAEVTALVAAVRDGPGVPDVLILNAGVAESAPVEALTAEHLDRHWAVNLRAPALLCAGFVGAMRRRGQGRIVHVASISATLGTPQRAAYNASKWGLVGFMRCLAAELSDTGVITLAVLPGSVNTDMLRGSGFAPRMTADDVARTLVHYALDAPAAHNGAVIEMFGT